MHIEARQGSSCSDHLPSYRFSGCNANRNLRAMDKASVLFYTPQYVEQISRTQSPMITGSQCRDYSIPGLIAEAWRMCTGGSESGGSENAEFRFGKEHQHPNAPNANGQTTSICAKGMGWMITVNTRKQRSLLCRVRASSALGLLALILHWPKADPLVL